MMWKILIVDDEAIIRESLKRFINWRSINATICGLAENGSVALDLILQDPPDIILCDISMPSLNGIELIEFLHHHKIPSEVIFISAYSNFEYARAALKYGAFDYILKPIEEQLILDCVKKCIQKISVLSSELFLCNVFAISDFDELRQKAAHLNFSFDIEAMTERVKNGDLDNLNGLIDDMFLYFLKEGLIYDLDLLKLKCIEFIDYILHDLEKHQLYDYLMSDPLTSKKNINAQRDLSKIYEIIKNLLTNLSSCFIHLREKSSSFLVRSALEYIHAHFGDDISLTTIANHLYISPTYLSKIFKSERGKTFSNYVLDYRIKMAKEYLKDPQYKIYQIAGMCGFSDVAHFSKCFKQVTDLSPNKYRNQIRPS